jgi:hypothetical protein
MSSMSSLSVRALFEAFHAAEAAPVVLASFASLVESAPVTPQADYAAFHAWLAPQLAYRQSTYLALIHTRWLRAAPWRLRAEENAAASTAAPMHVLISGAGPCGLRAACEAAVVMPRRPAAGGLHVHVVELRTECTRHNVLKMWQPTFDDLVGWGVLVCAPFMQTQQRHGHLHLATRGVQLCLLKAALLLGVRVHWGHGVCGLVDRHDGWHAWLLPSAAARAYLHATARAIDTTAAPPPPSVADANEANDESEVKLGGEKDVSRLEQLSRVDYVERAASQRGAVVPESDVAAAAAGSAPLLLPVDTLLVAEGEASRLIRRCGFDRHVMRYGEAIGIIVNLDAATTTTTTTTTTSTKERVLPEFVVQRMAADWRASCLGPLYDQGVELENLEYMRGAGTHFIGATTKTAVLHRLGVLRARLPTTRASLAPDNVDDDALRRLARAMATAVGVPSTSPLCAQHGAQLFDYSCKGVCTEPLRWLNSTAADGNERRVGRLPVLPVGDALQNPYWPQGLGVNRGFHTAVDAVWMAYTRVTTGDDTTAELERAHAFRTMQWRTFNPALVQPGAQWQVDPLTRYAAALQKSMHMHDLEHRAPAPSVPTRYRDAIGLVWPTALP